MRTPLSVSILLIIIVLFGITACPSGKDQLPEAEITPVHKIRIYALDWHQQSGFNSAVISEFERQNRCAVEVISFPTTAELLAALEKVSAEDSLDVVLGLDNAFSLSTDLSAYFRSDHDISLSRIERRIRNEAEPFLIPYARANVALLYNQRVINDPPESFGELQDSRFMNQLICLDPAVSGVGRTHLLWSLALFGEDGYRQLWSSLRKNIRGNVKSWNEGLSMLQKGEAGLMIGFSGTEIWLSETDPARSNVKASRFKEGSYQYVEYSAIHHLSPQPELSAKFIEHLIDPVTQLHTIYKLGLFPVNDTTIMPAKYASIPFSTYVLNDRLSNDAVREGMEGWLLFWEHLFSYGFTRSHPSTHRSLPT
ncbi:MAG: thiamine ABC transporter substrate-binding protein [Candidatus Cloacimonetes bacterium]|nr:thiamine ABC transporter substrate-binding protein [Candidatus Cloacimonadota bacterium]